MHAWDEWLAKHQAPATSGPVLVHVTPEEDYVWVHPCGCITDAINPMYPFCREHSCRAVFLGRRGDGYVTTGGGVDETAALVGGRP